MRFPARGRGALFLERSGNGWTLDVWRGLERRERLAWIAMMLSVIDLGWKGRRFYFEVALPFDALEAVQITRRQRRDFRPAYLAGLRVLVPDAMLAAFEREGLDLSEAARRAVVSEEDMLRRLTEWRAARDRREAESEPMNQAEQEGPPALARFELRCGRDLPPPAGAAAPIVQLPARRLARDLDGVELASRLAPPAPKEAPPAYRPPRFPEPPPYEPDAPTTLPPLAPHQRHVNDYYRAWNRAQQERREAQEAARQDGRREPHRPLVVPFDWDGPIPF